MLRLFSYPMIYSYLCNMKRTKTKKNRGNVIIYHDFRRTIIYIVATLSIIIVKMAEEYFFQKPIVELPTNYIVMSFCIYISLVCYFSALLGLCIDPVLDTDFDKQQEHKDDFDLVSCCFLMMLIALSIFPITISGLMFVFGICANAIIDYNSGYTVPFNVQQLRKLLKSPGKFKVRCFRFHGLGPIRHKRMSLGQYEFLFVLGTFFGIIAICCLLT